LVVSHTGFIMFAAHSGLFVHSTHAPLAVSQWGVPARVAQSSSDEHFPQAFVSLHTGLSAGHLLSLGVHSTHFPSLLQAGAPGEHMLVSFAVHIGLSTGASIGSL